ncbi:hypothetical protein EYF80_064717 [Liparis tanakae]|uniref:Uncharacterized protein n=1 Tax=Liparis tanakae TaxID=230148 RepID=A0A4Z2E9F5_9TELE|nr:hypothetical protein EYF80_064717 [Liparis tanakae]
MDLVLVELCFCGPRVKREGLGAEAGQTCLGGGSGVILSSVLSKTTEMDNPIR